MTATDDLRTRAREAAERYAWSHIDAVEGGAGILGGLARGYHDGFLARDEQLPGREEVARALARVDYGDSATEQNADWYGDHTDAVLALIRGGQS